MIEVLLEELAASGYQTNVSAEHSSSIFSEAVEDRPARFLIGATIVEARLNTHGSIGGSSTKSVILVKWEIFDSQSREVILLGYTVGSDKQKEITSTANVESFRKSFRALLAIENFNAILHRASSSNTASFTSSSQQNDSKKIEALAAASNKLDSRQIVGQVLPSVVAIESSLGRGTGFFISKAGLMLTNAHVVGSDYAVELQLYDQSVGRARVLQTNKQIDIALLQLESSKDPVVPVAICYADQVRVGEDILVIGNPIGLKNSVTRGIVSAIRTNNSSDLVQIDATVNPGNSGGPLINQYGSVIGIVSSKIIQQGIEGLGFAIPIGEALFRFGIQVIPPAEGNSCGGSGVQATFVGNGSVGS